MFSALSSFSIVALLSHVQGGGDHGDSDDITIYCATCGQPIAFKKALVHMERCFNKVLSYLHVVVNSSTVKILLIVGKMKVNEYLVP